MHERRVVIRPAVIRQQQGNREHEIMRFSRLTSKKKKKQGSDSRLQLLSLSFTCSLVHSIKGQQKKRTRKKCEKTKMPLHKKKEDASSHNDDVKERQQAITRFVHASASSMLVLLLCCRCTTTTTNMMMLVLIVIVKWCCCCCVPLSLNNLYGRERREDTLTQAQTFRERETGVCGTCP